MRDIASSEEEQLDELRTDIRKPLSLKQRVLSAGLWSLAGFVLSIFIRFGSNLLMTRLLEPEMFGVMAIATTVMVGLAMFSDVGLKQNIVQSKRGSDVEFLNTVWVIQILRGFLIWIVTSFLCLGLFVAANAGMFPNDSVYANTNLPFVLGALSVSAVISGFDSTKIFEASRGILLGRITFLEMLSQICGLTGMLVWVSFDRSIWALVFGSVTSSFARTLLSHIMLPGVVNRWFWNNEAAHEVLHFGKWILVASFAGFLVNSGDRLLLGGLIDARILGYYSIASLFVGAIEGVLAKIMSDVSFPAFSEIIRTKAVSLKSHYYRFLSLIAFVAYLASGFLMAFGDTLIAVLYDRRYSETGWILEVLAAILFTVPFRLATQSFLALGFPNLQFHVVLIRLISLILAVPLGFRCFGLEGALLGIVFSHFAYIPIVIYYNREHQLLDIKMELYLMAFVPAGFAIGKVASVAIGHG